jgi:hypothetical protein
VARAGARLATPTETTSWLEIGTWRRAFRTIFSACLNSA